MRNVLVSAICLLTLQLNAQVWTLPAKSFYGNISYSFASYDEKFDSTGENESLPNLVKDRTVSIFAQYGVDSNFTLQLNVPFKFVATSSGESDEVVFIPEEGLIQIGNLNTLGNIEFGGLYKLTDDKPFLTASFFAEANTSDRDYFSGLQTGFNSWGFKPGLGVGWSFSKSWLTFYAGGDIRTNNYSSSILSNAEIGIKPYDYLYFAALISLKQSLENGEDCDCTTKYTALYMNNQEYLAMSVKSGVMLGKWGLNAGFSLGLIAKNLPYIGYPTIGIQYKSK